MLRKERRLAIKLRLQGKSYSEIRKKIKASKSSISLWLQNYPLTTEQISKLTKRYRTKQIENYRNTVLKRREKRLKEIYEKVKTDLLPLSKREFLIAGLFLYLGEGGKTARIVVSNTDPDIVKFVLNWYTKALKVPKEIIRVQLQLYKDMDIKKEEDFWREFLNLDKSQFWKSYIKNTGSQAIDHSGGFKHGTCGINFGDIRLHEKIMMSIKAILNSVNQ